MRQVFVQRQERRPLALMAEDHSTSVDGDTAAESPVQGSCPRSVLLLVPVPGMGRDGGSATTRTATSPNERASSFWRAHHTQTSAAIAAVAASSLVHTSSA
jgi:hypothetical protein